MSKSGRQTLDFGFEGAIPQTASDIERAVRDGLWSLDANVLLNFYRFSPNAREALTAVLKAAGDRVWISHQAAREFWRNRMRAIDDRNAATQQLIDAVNKSERAIGTAVETWAKQTAVPEDVKEKVADQTKAGVGEILKLIDQESRESGSISYDPATDSVVRSLREILHGKVGLALSDEDHSSALVEAERRVKEQIPPGFRDADKVDSGAADGAAGDYLVWIQSVREAQARKLPLVVVTGDEKDDWWWKHRTTFLGPRAELVDEFRELASETLYMLRPIQLIEHADVLDVIVSEEAASDIKRATQPPAQHKGRWTGDAVHEMLRRLDAEASAQGDVIRFAAAQGGIIDRSELFEICGYSEDRMLRGFTRPTARITRDLQDDGLLDADVEPMLTPVYDNSGNAAQFEIPLDVVEILSPMEPLTVSSV